MMLRMRATVSMPASSVMVGGITPRIQRLPSSSFGKNSVPSLAPSSPQIARNAIAIVVKTYACPEQGIGIGARHRAKDLAFHALNGEQRQECCDRDHHREKNRPVDLDRRCQDAAQFFGQLRLGIG